MNPVIPIFLWCATPAAAQTSSPDANALYQWRGEESGQQLGACVAAAGDVNQDGYDDVVMGAPGADGEEMPRAGRVYVYSGIDGSLLHLWHGERRSDYFGLTVAGAGDVNADGYADVLVGAPRSFEYAGSVYVYSGADGSLIRKWQGYAKKDWFGATVAGAGDVNQDGFDDILVNALQLNPEDPTATGSVFLYSGADGALLHSWTGTTANEEFGRALAGAGDVNGDGYDDLILGASAASAGEFEEEGFAYVYSGKDGSRLHKWQGGAAWVHFGDAVSGAGDVNQDGYDDLLIGAPNSRQNAGSAFVFSGKDGAQLFALHGKSGDDLFGSSVSEVSDMTGDHIPDIVVGAHQAEPKGRIGAGSVYVYSGATGKLIGQWTGSADGDSFGWSVNGAGDLNGDGLAEIIVGTPYSGSQTQYKSGAAYVYTLANPHRLYQWDHTILGSPAVVDVAAAGDLNDDGYDDLIVGTFGAFDQEMDRGVGASAFSGSDGSLLHQWRGLAGVELSGAKVSGIGDINHDGFDDVCIGVAAASTEEIPFTGSVWAFSGTDGSLLHRWDGKTTEDGFGTAVSAMTDVNQDGIGEILVSAPGADREGTTDTGAVYLYSGADYSLLRQWNGPTASTGFGAKIADAGDVNRDGIADLIVGAPFASPGEIRDAGSAFVYSGADGSLLHQFHGVGTYDRLGFTVSGAGDFNQDGHADLLVGAPLHDVKGKREAGSVYLYSGADGSLLLHLNGESGGDNFGNSVANAGDTNGDHINDLVVGSIYAKFGGLVTTGAAYVYSGKDGRLLYRVCGTSSIERFGTIVANAGDVNADGRADIIVGSLLKSATVLSFPPPRQQ
jgi:FG-GAP repeat